MTLAGRECRTLIRLRTNHQSNIGANCWFSLNLLSSLLVTLFSCEAERTRRWRSLWWGETVCWWSPGSSRSDDWLEISKPHVKNILLTYTRRKWPKWHLKHCYVQFIKATHVSDVSLIFINSCLLVCFIFEALLDNLVIFIISIQ